jgi:ATP-dependent Clp protease adaptor protein ClpS
MRADVNREYQEDLDYSVSLEPLAKVILHNDSLTPYDFVIAALIRFFRHDAHQAELITWTAHNSESALVAVLRLDDARNKVGKAHFAASLEGYPLMFTVEPE